MASKSLLKKFVVPFSVATCSTLKMWDFYATRYKVTGSKCYKLINIESMKKIAINKRKRHRHMSKGGAVFRGEIYGT
jgi:hypothetical protein